MPKTHPFKARFAMSGKLKGIVPPVITPLTEDGQIDCIGLKKLLEHILDGGVHGLFILGTTGEGPALGYELQKKMIGETCALVGGRVPILVGISAAAMNDSVQLAQIARDSGACAAVCRASLLLLPRRTGTDRLLRNPGPENSTSAVSLQHAGDDQSLSETLHGDPSRERAGDHRLQRQFRQHAGSA